IMIGEDEQRLREALALISEVNLGATAIGTGINAPAGYSEMVIPMLADVSGVPVVRAENLVEATQDTGAFVQLSGVLKRVACKLSKTCNDLRLLSSGPQAGFGDILLPPRQAGSSIMPGKVNPVIPEVMNQVAFEVIGNDITITMAAEAGQLQLNAFEPIIAWSLHKSVRHLRPRARHPAGQSPGPRRRGDARRPPSRPRVEAEAARDRCGQHGPGGARGRLPRSGALERLPLSHRGNDRARSATTRGACGR